MLLERVHPILAAIGDVVDEIHDARQRAEDEEGGEGLSDRLGIEERGRVAALAEHQRGEDDQVLRPLRGAQGLEQETSATGRRRDGHHVFRLPMPLGLR